jgi:hypothetical protein
MGGNLVKVGMTAGFPLSIPSLRSLRKKIELFLTRGARFAVLEGGLYLRSAFFTRTFHAGPDIPSGLGGLAMVRVSPRWLLRFHSSPRVDAVLVEGFGRLGNSVIQVLNAFTLAKKLGAKIVLFHRFDLINNATLSLGAGVSLERTSLVGKRSRVRPLLIWRTAAMRGTEILDKPCSPEAATARAALSEGFAKAQSGRQEPPDTLTVHIRSGDVFWSSPHPGYGQPPLAFYTQVISHRSWKSVAVISEDLGNPVSDAVTRWCENEGIQVTQQCLDLPGTIELLASAHAIAAGRGTFVPALVYLFPRERELYLFEPSHEPLLCDPSVTLYEVTDSEGHYVEQILSKNWHNNQAQRTMMLEYAVSSLSEVKVREKAL